MKKRSYLLSVLCFILMSAKFAWSAPIGLNLADKLVTVARKYSTRVCLQLVRPPSSAEFRDSVQHLIPSMPVEKVKEWALENAENREKYNLSDDEVTSLFVFSTDGFMDVNHALREGKMSEEVAIFTHVLTRAMKQLPTYKGFVHRGVKLPSQELLRHQVGENVVYDGFTSTSQFRGFVDCPEQLRIYTHSGRIIRDFSAHKDEEEVVIPPGACFDVIAREDIGWVEYLISGQRTQLELKEIGKDPFSDDAPKSEDRNRVVEERD